MRKIGLEYGGKWTCTATKSRPGRGISALGLAAVGALLAGCVSTPTPTAETGPFPARYREMAKDYLKKTLVDPYSVRDVEIAEPVVKTSFHLVDPAPGWTICVRYNAKNRLGAYTGMTENALLVRGDRVTVSLNELTKPTPTAGICRMRNGRHFRSLAHE